METELRDNLLELATRYAEAVGAELSTISQRALGDWRFFRRLQESETASFTVRKYDTAVAWFAQRWPEGVEWPERVARPCSDAEAA